jgi:hypothetical protein
MKIDQLLFYVDDVDLLGQWFSTVLKLWLPWPTIFPPPLPCKKNWVKTGVILTFTLIFFSRSAWKGILRRNL